MTAEELGKLLHLAEQKKARDLASYATSLHKIEGFKAEISALTDKKHHIGTHSTDAVLVVARWNIWADKQIQHFEILINATRQEAEILRAQAAKSTGKVLGIEMLQEKVALEYKLLQRRRAEQNGVPPDA